MPPIMMIASLHGQGEVAGSAACRVDCSRDMKALPIKANLDPCQSPAPELASIARIIRDLCRIFS